MIPTTDMLLELAVLLLAGVALGQAFAFVRLPRVPGYLIAGVIFAEPLLGGALGFEVRAWSEPTVAGALGLVAYLIGGAITPAQLRRVGWWVLAGAIGGALGPVAIVAAGLFTIGQVWRPVDDPAQVYWALAAIAATTAPAATVAVIHQYRARGPFTQTLLGTVALDDAVGLLIFALIASLALRGGDIGFGHAVWEICGALLLGGVAGLGLGFVGRRTRHPEFQVILLLASVFFVTGAAERWDLSSLLAAMTLGFVARATQRSSGERLFRSVERLEEAVFVILFTLAGAVFEPSALGGQLGLVAVYVLLRMVGKVAGPAIGLTLTGSPPGFRRWFGMALAPQAGVAVGLALMLSRQTDGNRIGQNVVNVVLAATLINELVGPVLTRWALSRMGELGPASWRGTR